jgi:hypothetical protein
MKRLRLLWFAAMFFICLPIFRADARYYDARIGRFLTQDRYAAKAKSLSPYHYTANNPLRFIDVNGDSLQLTGKFSDQGLGLLQTRAGEDSKRISQVGGFVVVDQTGYKAGSNPFVDELIKATEAKARIGFELTDDKSKLVIGLDANYGKPAVAIGAYSNASTMPLYPGMSPQALPEGFQGYVKLELGLTWLQADGKTEIPFTTIVGHEIIESTERTIGRKYYPEAHAKANETDFGGTESDGIIIRPQ